MTLGVGLTAGLLAVAGAETVDVSITDGLPIVKELDELGPSAELDVHPATPMTTAIAHTTARQWNPGLLISMSLPGKQSTQEAHQRPGCGSAGWSLSRFARASDSRTARRR
jgi:hypothetical protein